MKLTFNVKSNKSNLLSFMSIFIRVIPNLNDGKNVKDITVSKIYTLECFNFHFYFN